MEPSNIHILVLDRDLVYARTIRDVLAKAGYKVSVAAHESDALHLAADLLFNVVVKSFDAQQIDAVALMEKVLGLTPDTQFIFLSDKGTIHTAVEAMRKGAFDYLSKPLNPAQLLEWWRKTSRSKHAYAAVPILTSSPEAVRLSKKLAVLSSKLPPPTLPCSLKGKAAQARKWWRVQFTRRAVARHIPLLP
jgi:DNA-binding NtrC family response regulator